MEIHTVSDSQLDMEYMPLCPFCDQPIFGDALVIRHETTHQLALVHANCSEEAGVTV